MKHNVHWFSQARAASHAVEVAYREYRQETEASLKVTGTQPRQEASKEAQEDALKAIVQLGRLHAVAERPKGVIIDFNGGRPRIVSSNQPMRDPDQDGENLPLAA